MRRAWMLALALGLAATPVSAQDVDETEAPPESESESELEEEEEEELASEDPDHDLVASDIVVAGTAEELQTTGGSAYVMGEEELERLDYDDPLSVLVGVPGVYVRQEDGYGLRPNIGIRGANAERSRRITLMEDGILLAPAPYSAPAAYYFPLITRMTSVDVFMGPSSIPYGPHTVGGAIDFHDRPIPLHSEGGVDLGLGSTWFGRFHGHYGASNEWGGFLVEAVHIRTDGYRHLDFFARDDSTGFDRTDVNLRGELHGALTDDIYHRLELVLALGLEGSNESYLGLSDQDLRADPLRRYGASSLDRMDWWRTRAMLRYELLSDVADLRITAYRHDFDRNFQRVDGFRDGTSIADVLQHPTRGRNAVYYGVLTGAEEATAAGQAIMIVRNRRVFVSEGIDARGRFRMTTGDVSHAVEVGARLHYDEIDRDHTGRGYFIEDASLVRDGVGELQITSNHAQSLALSAYAAWQLRFYGLAITPGIRLETVWGEFRDHRTGIEQSTFQIQPLPGIGATYELIPDLSIFAGVHQGYSPVAPGQAQGVRPELSVNYEVGTRYGRADAITHGELAFFASDYENITGECSGAGGCSAELVDRSFNGDRATILGIELNAAHTFDLDEARFPLRLNYTWTWTRFATAFVSENPQFGTVEVGDHLPYVPEHTLGVHAGFEWRFLALNAQFVYVSQMRDVAGHGPTDPSELTDDQVYLDAMASVEIWDGIRLYVRGENITNSQPIVARRPFGARSGRPLLIQGGLQADF